MTVEELEDRAFRGEPAPNLHSQTELLLFLSFRNLYDFAKRVKMPPAQGKKEKSQLLDAYRKYRFIEQLFLENDKMYIALEKAVSDYRKNRSLELADKIIEILYRVPVCRQEAEELVDAAGQ